MGTDEVVDNARSWVRSATACLGDGDNDDVLCRTVGKHVRREVERRAQSRIEQMRATGRGLRRPAA